MKSFVVAFLVLLVLHTAISFAAYRLSTTTSPVGDLDGEMAAVGSSTPAPVVLYIIFGYAGLMVSALWGLVIWLRRSV
jgi:hypothetical protein